MIWLVSVLVVAIVFAILYLYSSHVSEQEVRQEQERYVDAIRDSVNHWIYAMAKTGGLIPATRAQRVQGVMLQEEELLLDVDGSAQLLETRTSYETNCSIDGGAYTSIFTNVLNGYDLGLTHFSADGNAHTEAIERVRVVDVGKLVVTNFRIVFIGSRCSRIFSLADIVACEAGLDSFRIVPSQSSGVIGFKTAHAIIMSTIVKIMNRFEDPGAFCAQIPQKKRLSYIRSI